MNRDGKYGTLEMSVKPTADQKKRLRSFIGAVGGNVDVDFMDENYNTVHSVSYDSVSPARVLSGITNFYDKGIKPKGNVSYSVVRLPKEEYGNLSSIIMTRHHTYHRHSYDYAKTYGGFYVYEYLGDGDFVINFAIPNTDKNVDIIRLISRAIDNGIITDTASLDSYIEKVRSGKRGDIAYNTNALKKYERYRGVHIRIPSSEDNYTGGILEVGSSNSRGFTARGTSGDTNESRNQTVTENYFLNRTDIDYLDAVNRGDMETAQKLVDEAAKKAVDQWFAERNITVTPTEDGLQSHQWS